ncbi:MAG: HD domain-containing protein [candidate division Zixibacteria bacterium]|nr:HD domain-containing protein [candidate division Zixibacteria bacterium]NIR62876.1 HD domain-containing protein [candidate division Zixibacteria bacterium]NIS15984.1 HD domain-containing protein [candidate division Zixibacteria bacterium]NIS44891.1 HD domain-containing protein [candidate division Zixibacteria bacterium]NIT52393.1 HD domain-containing protein [candidate division Zixibacteria bacterium]
MTQPDAVNSGVQLSDAEKREIANLQALGRDLATQLYVCLKTASFYDPRNDNFRKQISKFLDLLNVATDHESHLAITDVDGYLFLNDQRLKIKLDGYLAAKYLQSSFENLAVAGIEFSLKTEFEELEKVFAYIVRSDIKVRNADNLNAYFNELGIRNIKFIPALTMDDGREDEDDETERTSAKKTFFQALSVVQQVMGGFAQQKKRNTNFFKAKRAIHGIIDEIIKNESYMLELTVLRNYDQYTYKHSVNVSVFAVALGIRLGLSKARLAELGFAALFHDFGKTRIPIDLLNKPERFNTLDWSKMHEHPVYGAKALAQAFPMDSHTARAMIVAFEHHKNVDGTGYPYINRTRQVNLYSRIVALCDFFDALTSGRVYSKNPTPIDEVITQMIKQAKVKFDPYLLKVLINIIGIYPVGSILLLDTGELALVVANNVNDIYRPDVRILADTMGKKEQTYVVQLAEYDKENEKYIRNISHLVDPDKYGIDISQYILES